MKFTTPKDNLAKALAKVNPSISTRATLPITQNVLIMAQEDKVTLQGTNLQTHISTSFPASVTEPGGVTVPARLLTEFVTSLPNDTIAIEAPPGSNLATLTCGKAQAHIHGTSPDDFPPTPQVPPDATVSLKPDVLRKAISRTEFCAATEESRPILTGIYLKFSKEDFVMAAADGFRMSVTRHPLDLPLEETFEAIVPVRTLQVLLRLLPDGDEPIEIRLSNQKGQALFNVLDTTLTSQLISGTFPNYEQLIPDSHNTHSVFNTKDLLRATKTASIFADQGSNIIRLLINGEDDPDGQRSAVIAAQADDVGDNQDTVTPQSIEGPDAKIALNSKYFRDALSAVDPDPVIIALTSTTSPAVLKPANPEDSFVQVVMPMFVHWAD